MSLSENSVIKREFNGNRSVLSKFMSDIEYSVITVFTVNQVAKWH